MPAEHRYCLFARTSSNRFPISLSGAPAARSRLDCCALLGTRGRPSPPLWQPTGSRQRRPGAQPVMRLLVRQTPRRA